MAETEHAHETVQQHIAATILNLSQAQKDLEKVNPDNLSLQRWVEMMSVARAISKLAGDLLKMIPAS